MIRPMDSKYHKKLKLLKERYGTKLVRKKHLKYFIKMRKIF